MRRGVVDEQPKKLPDVELDGRSFWPQCQGKIGSPRCELYHYYHPKFSKAAERFGNRTPQIIWAHDQRYKLYENGGLYDTIADRLELHPLLPRTDDQQFGGARRRLQNLMDRMPTDGAMLAPSLGQEVDKTRAAKQAAKKRNP
ncbi:MAG: hypothetical protein ACYTG0_10605 [Planctomycetota bacterium]|jgi:hypothetical protein